MVASKENISIGKMFKMSIINNKNYQYDDHSTFHLNVFTKPNYPVKCKNVIITETGTIPVTSIVNFQIIKYDISGMIKSQNYKKKFYKNVYYPQFGIKIGDLFRLFKSFDENFDKNKSIFDDDYQHIYKKILKCDLDYTNNPIIGSDYMLYKQSFNNLNELANCVFLFSRFNKLYDFIREMIKNNKEDHYTPLIQKQVLDIINIIIENNNKSALQSIVNIYYFGRTTRDVQSSYIQFKKPMSILDVGEKYCQDSQDYRKVLKIFTRHKKNNCEEIIPYLAKSYNECEHIPIKYIDSVYINYYDGADPFYDIFRFHQESGKLNHRTGNMKKYKIKFSGCGKNCSWCWPNDSKHVKKNMHRHIIKEGVDDYHYQKSFKIDPFI